MSDEHPPGSPLGNQRGAALLVMMLVAVMVTITVLMEGLGRRNDLLRRQAATSLALANAKQALIGFALTYGDLYPAGNGPGHLPCPDTDLPALDGSGNPIAPFGTANTPCGPNVLGRLPTSVTLPSGSPLPISSEGLAEDQQFWYAVSNAFLANARAGISTVCNSATVGTLSLDGQGDVVAVLIAPGPPLAGQSRPSSAAGNYLEAGNGSGASYVSSYPANPEQFNDTVVALRRQELVSLLTSRIAREMKKSLDAYHIVGGAYPVDQAAFATAFAGAPPWLAANDWLLPAITTYTRITADQASLVFAGCNATFTLNFGGSLSRNQPNC